ncbi:MAG: DUF4350 domain-containing protein [Bacteriovoracaceae bacterium]
MKWFVFFFVSMGGFLFSQKAVMTPLGPEGGVISLLKGSLNDDVVIAVVREQGIFRSTDGGNTWKTVVLPFLPTSGVDIHDIVFHPSSSDTVLLTTTQGLYRSNNQGVSFTLVPSNPSPQQSIEYSQANPSILFGSDMKGPLKSIDGGNNWSPLKDGLYFGDRFISQIAVHPADTGNNIRLLAAAGFDDSVGLFFSSNSGMTWKPFNKGLASGIARRIYKVEIDTMGTGRSHFRAVIGTANGIYGAQTNYSDTTWISLSTGTSQSTGVVTDGILVYDHFDPTDTIYGQHKFALYYSSNASEYDGIPRPFTEKNGLFKIASKYNSLFRILEPPPEQRIFAGLADIISLFIPSEKNKSKIYLGTTNGIFISIDDGITWERKNSGINNTIIRNTVSLPSPIGGHYLFAGIFGGGIMRSSNEGGTWSEVNNGVRSPYILSLDVDKKENILYAGTAYSVYRSIDRGQSWTELFKVDTSVILNPTRFTNRSHEISVRHSPVKSTNVMFNSTVFGLWMSTNGGGTWNNIVPPGISGAETVPENIEFDPIDASTIYYAAGNFFKSTNAGQTWTDISTTMPKQGFNPFTQSMDGIIGLSPTINPLNTKEIFLATVFLKGEGIPFRLFKTTDGGTSWDPLSVPIPVYDILYDPIDARRLVAGGPAGIFRTVNGGSTWTRVSDSASAVRYFLVHDHYKNSNVFYAGSEQGAYSFELPDYPKLTIDTALYDFGSIIAGTDSIRKISLNNQMGNRNVLLSYLSLSDSVSFTYGGPTAMNIPAGGEFAVPVTFTPGSSGLKFAVLRFATTDLSFPLVQIALRGHGFNRYPFEKFVFGFGTVSVDRDSTLEIPIPNESQQQLTVSLLQNSDSVNFSLMNGKSFSVDTGTIGSLVLRFHPKSSGEHRSILRMTTNDPRFPEVKLLMSGSGVRKNYLSRKVVIDTAFGIFIEGSKLISEYYEQFRNSLAKAGLNVNLLQPYSFTGNHSIAIIQPSLPIIGSAKDALQNFVASGGTVVLIADHRDSSAHLLNLFLRDPEWLLKYGATTGIQFGQTTLFDSALFYQGLDGAIISTAALSHKYTFHADSILFSFGTFLTVDTSAANTNLLYTAKSQTLFSINDTGGIASFAGPAVTAAYSTIGAGRIIAVADPELWWNGVPEDTTSPFGIYGAQNLQFALNVFGSIENITASLRETIEERYELISIPYTFEDSTVLTLFKDLGENNNYLWRMFGKFSKAGGYKEFPKDFSTINRGEGYWLITKEKKQVKLGMTSLPGVAEDFEIEVHPGYTMIGNPFPYTVSWTNSVVADSVEKVLWSYSNGKYDTTSVVMEALKGYWVFNRGKTPKIIRINAVPVEVSAVPKVGNTGYVVNPQEWKMHLMLTSTDGTDSKNFIGVTNTASDGWDDEDFVKPPALPSQPATLTLKNHGENLSADYRARNDEGHSWEFSVSGTSPYSPLRITAEQFGTIPQKFRMYLVDLKSERMFDFRTSTSYEFSFQKNEKVRQFRFITGTSKFLEEHSDGIPVIPLDYSLSQNYPNPFNPVTTIHYSISNRGEVKLVIFNVLGQKVRTLVHLQHLIGSYSVTWDGKDNNGILLSSGIYYYQIQANNYRSVKKMTFIK